MSDSTRKAIVEKWRKWKRKHPKHPLTVAPNGQWCRKILGKTRYFGPLENVREALEIWEAQAPYLLAGREPPKPDTRCTVDALLAKFREDIKARARRGEIGEKNATELRHACRFVEDHLNGDQAVEDLTPEQFAELRDAVAKTGRNLRSQKNLIGQIRSIFLWGAATERGMGFYQPVRFGPRFRMPSADALRVEKEAGKQRFIEAADVQKLLAKAKPAMRCMILLGVNCGFYAQDSTKLTFSRLHLDHDPPYHDFARVKNGRPRKAVLWAETVDALREYIQHHRGDHPSDIVILTQYHRPYNDQATGRGLRTAFQHLLASAGVTVSPGTSIGSLRHVYGTVADLCNDQGAIDLSMGHAPRSLQKAVYRQQYLSELDRLAELAQIVHDWLWPDEPEEPAEDEGGETPDTIPFRGVG